MSEEKVAAEREYVSAKIAFEQYCAEASRAIREREKAQDRLTRASKALRKHLGVYL